MGQQMAQINIRVKIVPLQLFRIADSVMCSVFRLPHERAILHDPKASCQFVINLFISLLPSYSPILQCSKCTSALCDQRYVSHIRFYRNIEFLGKSLGNSVHRRQCVPFTKVY